MARIFISYARADVAQVLRLAEALKAAGHEVWWDIGLKTAEDYRDKLAKEIKRANAVIVVWSAASVGSRWVKAEANLAFGEEKLIPVRFEEHTPELPMPMNSMHVANLHDWLGTRAEPQFHALEETIFKVAHDRFAETLLQFGGGKFEQTIDRNRAARAVLEIGSTIAFIPIHRFIRGAVLCALGLAFIAYFVEHFVAQEDESFLDMAFRGLVSISLARLCLQIVNLSKGIREQRFFDPSFSYWIPVFFLLGVVYFIIRLPDDEYQTKLGDSITIAVGGLVIFYFVRCLVAGYRILVGRSQDDPSKGSASDHTTGNSG